MPSAPVLPALFAGLFDDAALFPPGDAPMVRAVPEHRQHEAASYAGLVGPFVCPDSRVDELIAEIERQSEAGALPVSIVVGGGPFAVEEVFSNVVEEHRLRLVAMEVPLGSGDGSPARAAAAAGCLAELSPGVVGYVEVPRGDERDQVLDVLAAHRVRAKLRTGGPSPASFPPDAEIAAFIHGCAERDLPFKCTAGLHGGVRHDVPGPSPGEVLGQQGFLNILVATSASLDGAAIDEITAVLADRGEAAVAAAVASLGREQVIEARRRFRSFGTCSVAEPIEDLVRLGLLERRFAAP